MLPVFAFKKGDRVRISGHWKEDRIGVVQGLATIQFSTPGVPYYIWDVDMEGEVRFVGGYCMTPAPHPLEPYEESATQEQMDELYRKFDELGRLEQELYRAAEPILLRARQVGRERDEVQKELGRVEAKLEGEE